MADNTTLTPQQKIEEQLKKVREQTQALFSQIEKEGITNKTGETLVTPAKPSTPIAISSAEVTDVSALPPLPYNPPQEALNALTNIGANAGSLISYYQQQAQDEAKRLEEVSKQAGKIEIPEAERETKLEETKAKFKVPEMSAEVQQQSLKVASLKGTIDKLDVERTTELDKIYSQQGVGMRFISGQADETNRKYDVKKAYASAELGAQSALLQAQVGNLQLAQGMIDDVVNAYTFDIQAKRQDVKDLLNNYTDLLKDLTSDQRETITNLADRLERQETVARTEKNQLMDWMIQYPTSGITLNDTLENAAKKARIAAQQKEEVSTLTSFDDILQASINAGDSPEVAARTAQAIAENQGLQLTPQQVERLKQRATLMKPVVTEQAPETPPTPPSSPVAAAAGAKVGEFVKEKAGRITEFPRQQIEKAASGVSSFFKGLFGF